MFKQLRESDLVMEMYGGEPYEYFPLGKHIAVAPGVCGGRPTFKYTRHEVSVILAFLGNGATVDDVLTNYHRSNLSREAILEAIRLTGQAPLDILKTRNIF